MALFLALLMPAAALAQSSDTPESDPGTALSAALSAACRADPSQFEKYLTVDSAAAFHTLSAADRAAFLKRFSLSDDPGKALVSASQQNRTIVRCVTEGGTAEFRFGDQRVHDNLAFIRVDVVDSEQTTFGLVHEDGVWRLLSLGLVMLDVPQLAKQWGEADLVSREGNTVSQLSSLAGAVETYRRAYGKLPDSLAQLGPRRRARFRLTSRIWSTARWPPATRMATSSAIALHLHLMEIPTRATLSSFPPLPPNTGKSAGNLFFRCFRQNSRRRQAR